MERSDGSLPSHSGNSEFRVNQLSSSNTRIIKEKNKALDENKAMRQEKQAMRQEIQRWKGEYKNQAETILGMAQENARLRGEIERQGEVNTPDTSDKATQKPYRISKKSLSFFSPSRPLPTTGSHNPLLQPNGRVPTTTHEVTEELIANHDDHDMDAPVPPLLVATPPAPQDLTELPTLPNPVKHHGFWSCSWEKPALQPTGNHELLPVAPGPDQGAPPPSSNISFAFFGDNNSLWPALLPPNIKLEHIIFLVMVPPNRHFAVTSIGTQSYLQQPGNSPHAQPWSIAGFKSLVQPILRLAKIQDGSSTTAPQTVDRLAIADPIKGIGAIATILVARDDAALEELKRGYGLPDAGLHRRSIDDGFNRSGGPNRSEIVIGTGYHNLRSTYKNLYNTSAVADIHSSQIMQLFPYTCIISPPNGLAHPFPTELMNDTDIRAAIFQEGAFVFRESIDMDKVDRNLIHTRSLKYETLTDKELERHHKPPGSIRCQLAITNASVATHIDLGPADRGYSALPQSISPWYGCINDEGRIIIFPTSHVHTPAETAKGLHNLEHHSLVCRVEIIGPEIKPNIHCRVCGHKNSRFGSEAASSNPTNCCDAPDFLKYEAAEKNYRTDREAYIDHQRKVEEAREEEVRVTESAIRHRELLAEAIALEARLNAEEDVAPAPMDTHPDGHSHPTATTEASYAGASSASSAATIRHTTPVAPHQSADPLLKEDARPFKEIPHKPQRYTDSRNQVGISSSYSAMAAHTYTMDIPLLGLIAGPKPAYPRDRDRGRGKGGINNRGRGGGRGKGFNAQHAYEGKGKGKGNPQWDY